MKYYVIQHPETRYFKALFGWAEDIVCAKVYPTRWDLFEELARWHQAYGDDIDLVIVEVLK